MKVCPHCREYVTLHIDRYRCDRCHVWLEPGEPLEVKHKPTTTEADVANCGAEKQRKPNTLMMI